MSDRPRVVNIGSPTWVRAKAYKNSTTGQLIIGATGTVKIFSAGEPGAVTTLLSASLLENLRPGNHSAFHVLPQISPRCWRSLF